MAFYVGDGYCDDDTNNYQCDFDGGDCCLDPPMTDYCVECLCLEIEIVPLPPAPPPPIGLILGGSLPLGSTTLSPNDTNAVSAECLYSFAEEDALTWMSKYQNGICDDKLNTPQCNFDGGDCCSGDTTTENCKTCLCYEELNQLGKI